MKKRKNKIIQEIQNTNGILSEQELMDKLNNTCIPSDVFWKKHDAYFYSKLNENIEKLKNGKGFSQI